MKKVVMDVGEKYPEITGAQAQAFINDLLSLEKSSYDEIILDFKDTSAISSIAMGTLYSTFQTLSSQKRSIRVINPTHNVSRLLKLVNMNEIIDETPKLS